MAKSISENLEKKYQFPNRAYLHVKIKLRKVILEYRKYKKKFMRVTKSNNIPQAIISKNFDAAAMNYQRQRWVYIEQFWSPDFNKSMVSGWPNNCYFDSIKYITKSYDQGLAWSKGESLSVDVKLNPVLTFAYPAIISGAFAKRVSLLAGDGIERECTQILLTRAYSGSSVIPHIDSANDPCSINMIIFIDGNDGGLGIWEDNEFENNIFTVKNLNNTCMLYDMSEGFYHGFEPMKLGKYRWAMSAKFTKC